jgi:hypothetical protein
MMTAPLHRAERRLRLVLAFVVAVLPFRAAGEDRIPPVEKPRLAPPALGVRVPELGKSAMYVLQAKNNDFWFGSNDRGAYRYDGKTLVNFTTQDGLCSNRIRGIQEDRAGCIYFTTYEGISRFDGRSFKTLEVAADSPASVWRKHPDDLWFVGPPDAGVVFRFDGRALHRLRFPATELGDRHFAAMPRAKFPHAVYSPYDVYCILRDRKGDLWFGATCVGVCRYDGKTFEWLTDSILTAAPVRAILEDRQGRYWFSYSGSDPFPGAKALPDFGKLQPGAQGTVIAGMSIVEDRAGKLWTAALEAGAFRHDGPERVGFPIKEGGAAIAVFAVYTDNQGVVWLGTHNGGAYQFNGTAFVKFRP